MGVANQQILVMYENKTLKMNKHIGARSLYIAFLALLILSCKTHSIKSVNSISTVDTSINNQLILRNANSIERTIGDIMQKLDKNKDLPDVYFSNSSRTEVLRMVFFPGDHNNQISIFEVIKGDLFDSIVSAPVVKYNSFVTESGIGIGMSKLNVIKKKGNSYLTSKDKSGLEVLRYTYDKTNDPIFLTRYNMPSYFAEYCFNDNVLVRFAFGFDYP